MSIWKFILYHLGLSIYATIKKITLRIMLGSIPHQKFCFYHLPTRGRAGIKLRDAWYVSNVSIILDCSMLLYFLLWMFMGFTLHFYIIFGTNLLTGSATRIAVFLPISVFRRKGISNGIQMEWNLRESYFWNKYDPRDLEWMSRNQRGGHEAGRRAPHPRGPLAAPPTYFFLLYIPIYPKPSRSTTKPYFHRRNLLYPRDPILGPFPELRWRGHWSRRASTSTPWPSDDVWVVYLRPSGL